MGEGIEQEFGLDMDTLLYLKQIPKSILLSNNTFSDKEKKNKQVFLISPN